MIPSGIRLRETPLNLDPTPGRVNRERQPATKRDRWNETAAIPDYGRLLSVAGQIFPAGAA